MKDFKAISNTVKNGLKQRVFGKSSYGNIVWKEASFAWYETNRNLDVLQDFKPYFNAKRKMIKTVLEVGCGAGVYPIKEKELFNGVEYTGNDFSENNIEYCKNHSDFNFIAGDFIKMDINQKYDLVYSHGVIDHVYDIDTFLLNLVKVSSVIHVRRLSYCYCTKRSLCRSVQNLIFRPSRATVYNYFCSSVYERWEHTAGTVRFINFDFRKTNQKVAKMECDGRTHGARTDTRTIKNVDARTQKPFGQ